MKLTRRMLLGLGLAAAVPAARAAAATEKAIFAGGCFWCMTPPFEKLEGVTQVLSGYTDGQGENPTYQDYAERGFVEVVEVSFDPSKISYSKLLDVFWRQINPTDAGGQFVDRGPEYRSVIYYLSDAQKRLAEKSKAELAKSGRFKDPLVTEIKPAAPFWKAEEYHQDYYKKNPVRYHYYRWNAGRDQFLESVWGKPEEAKAMPKTSKEDLKKNLSPLQYKVTQEAGTEPPFQNAYWDNHKDGIYVDVVSGEPLFSSTDKYDSGTGWPSFTRPLEPDNIVTREDKSFFSTRTEVRSKGADSHLGHVFDDGPAPTHMRYCMNSAAMRFIPKEDLDKEGLGRYDKLFVKK